MTDQEQLDALKNTFSDLNSKARELRSSIRATEKVLAADIGALKNLTGTHYSIGGDLPYTRRQIENLERKIEDSKKTRVVWEERSDCKGDHIIDKVTSKRIAVKRIGGTLCEQFNRDGTPVSKLIRQKIDLKATFGDDYSV